MAIKDALQKVHGLWLRKPIGPFHITRRIAFANSRHDKQASATLWHINFYATTGQQRTPRRIAGDAWQKALGVVASRIPDILFFPNFLFDFPERIYLDADTTAPNADASAFYRVVLQDILDALENSTSVGTHIYERARSRDANDRRSLDGLLLDMSRHVTQTVFSAWDEMFDQQPGPKRVVFTCGVDDTGRHFVNLRLEDSDGAYQIRERSLGFRWFFTFLLLTHYRGFRRGQPSNVLFMFDEPASNLHQTAQSQLLKSFAKLSEKRDVIYTTHSHHLINPNWLETAFVVRNEALDYATNALEYSAKKTDITVTRYREFAAKHPDQTSYFQPILDVLDYSPSALESVPDVVMVEGKTDFYVLKYLALALGPGAELPLLPGTGAGSLGVPIQLYLAWGRPFLVLLDSDPEGARQGARYVEEFGEVMRLRVRSLGEFDATLAGRSSEALFSDDERLALQKLAYPDDTRYTKKHFHRALQEQVACARAGVLSSETRKKAEKLCNGLKKGLLAVRQAATE